jgi:cell division protein YceG involved in septum cleavage
LIPQSPPLPSQANDKNPSLSLTVFHKVFNVLVLILKASNTLHYEKSGVIIDYNFQERVLTFTKGSEQLTGLFSLQYQWQYLDGFLTPDTFTFITTTVKSKVIQALKSQSSSDFLSISKAPTIFADFLTNQQSS